MHTSTVDILLNTYIILKDLSIRYPFCIYSFTSHQSDPRVSWFLRFKLRRIGQLHRTGATGGIVSSVISGPTRPSVKHQCACSFQASCYHHQSCMFGVPKKKKKRPLQAPTATAKAPRAQSPHLAAGNSKTGSAHPQSRQQGPGRGHGGSAPQSHVLVHAGPYPKQSVFE